MKYNTDEHDGVTSYAEDVNTSLIGIFMDNLHLELSLAIFCTMQARHVLKLD